MSAKQATRSATTGAISIARRVQDPLAELVKIDPKSIGVGQYQHDVHQPLLRRKLDDVVESCVNHVGVEVNTASAPLLERVAGIGRSVAAHIVAQVAIHQGRRVYAFVRPGDAAAQRFAESLGVHWAGASDQKPEEPLDAAILYAPVGALVPAALEVVRPGGSVVCAGIHMSDIPAFPYRLLWQERTVRSVANLTREDAREFLSLASVVPITTHVRTYPLLEANAALGDLRSGRLTGAAVLVPQG